MGFFRTGVGYRRPFTPTRIFVSRLSLGQIVSSVWPRHRGRPRTRLERALQDRLREVTRAVKTLNDREVNPTRQALAEHNRKNRGLRGSSAIRQEDWDTARLYGRLWAVDLPNGRRSFHIDAVQDVSRRLDWFEPRLGSLLVRTADGWQPTVQCQPGRRLTLQSPGPSTLCCDDASMAPQSEGPP